MKKIIFIVKILLFILILSVFLGLVIFVWVSFVDKF